MIVSRDPARARRTAQPVSPPAFAHDRRQEPARPGVGRHWHLTDLFEQGLTSPICLTWELTYACNLACVHCLSSSGRRDPRELTTAECRAVIDTLQRMQVFYVNIGGGEPTVRPDFWELVDYATAHQVGVKFSTNGIKLDADCRPQAGRQRLRRRADLAGRRHGRGQRRGARGRLVPHGDRRRWLTWPPPGSAASSSPW